MSLRYVATPTVDGRWRLYDRHKAAFPAMLPNGRLIPDTFDKRPECQTLANELNEQEHNG